MIPNDIIPIHWFGDRKAYEKSSIRVVTVGLNPSDKEFRENDRQPFSTQLRFPLYKKDKPETLELSLNYYFKSNPYFSWFNSFEYILNGMGASYYDCKGYSCRAIHTDICSPWATDPTWFYLAEDERESMRAKGTPQWINLISELNPHVIIASVAEQHIEKLGIAETKTEFCKFPFKKDGSLRNRPETVFLYDFHGIPFVNGRTRNKPFGSLSNDFKRTVGDKIKNTLIK